MLARTLLGAAVAAATISATLASSVASAGENLWVYSKGTDTRPQGSYEFKLSDVIRSDKNAGSYDFHDIRPELEYGITDSLTISAEAVIYDHNYSVGTCDDGGPGPMCEAGDESGNFDKLQFAGYELAMKYNVLSPYKDAFGLSFGLAYERRDKYRLDGADTDQDSISFTTFLQKDFMDNTLVTVVNIKTEFERRKSPDATVLEEELSLEMSAAISYRVAPQWFVGLEFRHQSDYLSPEENGEPMDPSLQGSNFDLGDFTIGSQHQYGNYFGPSVHYAAHKWWATAGVLWQISGGGSQHADVRSDRNWDEHEKMHIGLNFGYEM